MPHKHRSTTLYKTYIALSNFNESSSSIGISPIKKETFTVVSSKIIQYTIETCTFERTENYLLTRTYYRFHYTIA